VRAVLTPQAAPAEKEEKNERNFRYHDIGGIRRQFRAVEVYGYLSLSRRFKKAFIEPWNGCGGYFCNDLRDRYYISGLLACFSSK
jgi:hypothetical protein